MSVKDKSTHTEVVSGTHDITVSLGPSVTIAMPSTTPYYRGTALNPTINFHNLVQGSDYTYTAYLMARNPINHADICEGTGLERNRTFTLNGASGNPVQKSVTISDQCPTNEYTIHVGIKDDDDRKRGAQSVDFEISTDPDATPSVSVSLSESSPIAPGTQFDVTFNFYDIQPGTAIVRLDTMTNTSTNQAVGQRECGGSLVGWGVDVSGTVNHNPYVNDITIPSDCPAGSYRIVSKMKNSSGNEFISGSVDFIIGDPDLTPTAPDVPNYIAKQNSPFDQTLDPGSGGDGTLSYSLTQRPPGLSFTPSTRRIEGIPTAYGVYTPTYTVTDSDGDPDSVQFNITVEQDFSPSPPSIPDFTGKVGVYFEKDIPRGTGSDTPLSFSVSNLPDGLEFYEASHKITGTPTTVESPTVTYTARDDDGDEESTTFRITISGNSAPQLDDLSAVTYNAKVGLPFTKTLPVASGGDGDLVYATTNRPGGLDFAPATRTIHGTPTTEETKTVTYSVRDEDQEEDNTTFTIVVNLNKVPTLADLSGNSHAARVGSPFTLTLPAGTGDGVLEYTASNLPEGLHFYETSRMVTGTPTMAGNKVVTYKVADEDEEEASTTFTINVSENSTPQLDDLSGDTYTAKVGLPFTKTLPVASGGDGDLVYATTNRPGGLDFTASTRTIHGTPTTVETKTVTYSVQDEDQDEDSTTFTIVVNLNNVPTLADLSGNSHAARVGSPFTLTLPAGTGDGVLEYTASNLPEGLHFYETSRMVTGTPTMAGNKVVTYKVADEDEEEASTTFTINVSENSTPQLDDLSGDTYTAKVGLPFTKTLPVASGGDGDLDYDATGLPPGLSFVKSTRIITGTPTTANKYEVTYTATDEDEDVASQKFFIEVFAMPSLQVVPNFMATKDEVFTLELTAVSGGREPFDYDATPLPTGLSFVESSLTITGTPTQVQEIQVTFSVEDKDGDTASRQFKISVSEGDTEPTFAFEIPDYELRVGSPFAVTLPGATGGNSPYTYTISELPEALVFISATRQLRGTPGAGETGSHNITYTATDRDLDPVSQTFELDIAADNAPAEPSIADMHLKVGKHLRAELPAGANGDPPYTYAITTLPSGLNFDRATRILSGGPDSAGSMAVTYTVLDDDGDSAEVNFTINVYALPDLRAISDQSGMKDDLFTLRLPEATGGRTPLEYSATGLPVGLQFITETRTITGTLTQVEIADVTYTVTDFDDDQDSVTFKITVTDLDQSQVGNNNNNNNNNNGGTLFPPALTLTDTTGFTLRVGEQFTQQLPAANGGTPPYRYSVTTLPDGLHFNEGSHTISGTPTTAGISTVRYTVTDDNNSQVVDDFTLTINPPVLSLVDLIGFSATVGELFTQQLPAAIGGTSPYAYGVTILPEGLSFEHATRTITGTPTLVETKVVTYSVSDGNRDRASDSFTITISAAQTVTPDGTEDDTGDTPGSLQLSVGEIKEFAATVGVLFTRQLPAASGGSSPYAYGVSVLPAGLDFEHATRTITGTPSSVETKVVTYRVSDGELSSASDTFTITVSAGQTGQPLGPGSGNTPNPLQLSIGATKEFSATAGQQYTQQLPAASGGSSPYAYGVTTLPDGLNFVQATRTITGTPTTAETREVTYSVTDATQASASDTFTITVAAGQTGPPGQPGNGGSSQGGKSPGGNPSSGNQGSGNKGGGSSGSKGNSGGGGGSSNQPKYVPPASSHAPQQQQWSPSPVPVAITVPPWLNVRRGPGLGYEVMATVPAGTRGNIYGKDPADAWFQVQIDAASNMVWVCQNLTTVEGSLNGVRFLEQWEIDLIPKPADGPIATTTPAILNVRAGPGLTYRILTTVPKGTQATIIGIGPNAEWYKVTLDALSKTAWIYAGLTTVDGLLGGVKRYTLAEVNENAPTDVVTTDTCNANPVAITIPAVLNVRNGPGTQHKIITTVVKGTRAEIVGIDPQEQWLLVNLDSLTDPAWIYRNLTTVVGSLAGVRRVSSGQVEQPDAVTNTVRPIAVTYPSLVNIRVGPGLTFGILKAVSQGTRAKILGVSPDENWYLVEIDGMSQLGWIREDLTVLVGNLNGVKRITAEEIAMLPVAIVDTPTLNVRTGPGLGYSLVTTISKGTWVQIVGANAQTDWLQIRLAGVSGQTWVYRDLTSIAGLLPGVTRISSSTVSEAADDNPDRACDHLVWNPPLPWNCSANRQQIAVNSITIELSLPQDGRYQSRSQLE